MDRSQPRYLWLQEKRLDKRRDGDRLRATKHRKCLRLPHQQLRPRRSWSKRASATVARSRRQQEETPKNRWLSWCVRMAVVAVDMARLAESEGRKATLRQREISSWLRETSASLDKQHQRRPTTPLRKPPQPVTPFSNKRRNAQREAIPLLLPTEARRRRRGRRRRGKVAAAATEAAMVATTTAAVWLATLECHR